MSNREYVAIADQNIAASPGATLITLQSAATIRPVLTEFTITAGGTMADATIQYLVRRFDTDDGTGTAVTPRPVDTLDGASVVVVQSNHTAEPSSFTMSMMDLYAHLRGILTWRSRTGRGLVLPAVAREGIGITPIHATQTNAVAATVFFEE